MSDYIPIGANAENVETNDGVSVENILNKTPYYYNSVADMKADADLAVGDMVVTLGYYEPNDGGDAEYKITNTISANKYQEELENGFYANLIVNKKTNILHYGAVKNDNSASAIAKNNLAFTNMINKQGILNIPSGVFDISNNFTLNNNSVNCDGRINYNGTDYCFIITHYDTRNFYVHYFYSSNGGFLKICPTTSSEGLIYSEFKMDYVQTNKESILIDGTYGSTSLCNFIGKKLRSSNADTIKMIITNGNNTYINENTFIGMDLKSPSHRAFYSDATGTGTSIQYKLENVDMESSLGIYSANRSSNITLLNCRLDEISYHDNWITIENSLPKITILGAGIIYPKKIQLINISSNANFLFTNMDILVNDEGHYYHGGAINKNFVSRLDYNYSMVKSITSDDLINDHYYTLPLGYNENHYNYFSINLSSWVQITVPYSQPYYEFIVRVVNSVNVTWKGENADLIFGPMQAGYYKMYYIGRKLFYTKLDEE